MVLALAGAALLYSGCTKDYQKDIDDLNTEVATLQNTVQKLQDQVSALEELRSRVSALENADKELKTLIDACNAEIKKIQEGYATKEELESGLTALKNEITETLNGLAADVKDNADAIAALQDAYAAVGEFAGALNTDKIASVVLVPSMSYYNSQIYEPAINYTLTNYNRRGAAEPLFETERMVDLHFAVRPASLASSLNSENTVLNVVVDGLGEISYPVTIYDADPETGDVYLVSEIACPAPKYAPKFNDNYIYPFSLEVSDITEGGVYNSIQSPFYFAYETKSQKTNLQYFFYDVEKAKPVDELSDIEVPWNEYATSERSFYEGYAVGLGSEYGLFTLDEAAYIFGVDVADITPELHILDRVNYSNTPKGSDNIAVDIDAWTAKMKATKADAAKAAVDAWAKVTIEAYFNQDFEKYTVARTTQDYWVVVAEGKTITIGDYNFPWIGENKTPADAKALNLPVSDKIKDGLVLEAYDANGAFIADAVANVDGELVNVTFTTQMTFKDKAQTITFVGYPYYADTETYDTVVFTVTLDPKPANKKLDLGVFTIDGSSTKSVPVALDGIIKALVNGDEALYANFSKSPLYQTIAVNFDANKTISKIGVEYSNGTVAKYEGGLVNRVFGSFGLTYWDKDAQDGSHKAGDASTLTMYRPVYGATYTFFGSTTAYGVNYEFTFQVVVNPADFALVTTPNVSAGNIINVYAEIAGSLLNPKYTINDVYFSDYFEISKVVKDELYVNFVFDYEYKDADKGIYYAGNALWGTSKEIVPTGWRKNNIVRVNEASKTLVREGNFLNWNNYEGRQIYGTATLGYLDGLEFIPVGDAIEFTLVTPDPIKTFEVTPITTDERVAGKNVTVDLSSSLALTSQIDGITIKPAYKWGDKGVHYWSYYDLSFGFFDAETGMLATEAPAKIEGTLNGQPFTFVKGTHYTVDDYEITFLANNAYGDITFSVPVGIEHVYGYGVAEHSANLEVTIPQHKQDAPAGE